jgi:aliphatic nitrilase
MRKVRAGVVQAAPVLMNLKQTLDKTLALIEEAAADDIEILAFPELWLPGYPWFAWLDSPIEGARRLAAYHANSMAVDSSDMRAIRDATAKASMHVLLGFSEKANASRYMSQALILPNGELGFVRRKIKPTGPERFVFGEGDGSDLKVAATAIGRIGALNCWENLVSFARLALINQHEEIHVSSWPSLTMGRGSAEQFGPNMLKAISSTSAIEGGMFVLAATAVTGTDAVELLCDTEVKRQILCPDGPAPGGGFSMIYGPDGMPLVEALDEALEGIVAADLDLDLIGMAKTFYDAAGHYTRNDVFRFQVDHSPRRSAHDAGLAPAPRVSAAPPLESLIAE